MPAPRAAVHARKSVVPDPDLYADSDDSDDQQRRPPLPGGGTGGGGRRDDTDLNPPPSKKSRASTGRGLVRKGSKGPQPVRGSVTAEGGRRRSTRLSNEHPLDDNPAAPAISTAVNGTKPAKTSRKRTKPDDRRASASGSEDDAEGGRRHGEEAAAASQSRPQSKRPRTDPDPPASTTQRSDSASAGAAATTGAAAGPPRRAFIPRAAANLGARVNKPLSTYSAALVDPEAEQGGDDARPFLFTTNPPTPYGKGAAGREAAAEQARGTKGKATAAGETEDAGAPEASTSLSNPKTRRRRTPPRQPVATKPLPAQETPVQVRNIAFRQGLPPGTPATIVRTARRSSARGSGKRGSSIGGGFEATPHPQVADDKLYRSTDASDPIAKRMRSIVSWSSQRVRDRMFRSVREDEMSAAQTTAKSVIDAFIEDVCSLRVDTSVPYQESSQSQDPSRLPPHPHNESNATKMQELEDSYAAIAREQELRQSLEPVYQAFFDGRTQAHAEASTSYVSMVQPAIRSNPSSYAATLDLSVPAPSTLEEALAIGRRVMEGQLVRSDGGKTPAKKGKGKAKATADDEETPQEAMQRRIASAQIDTAAFRHQTHRLSSFVRVASAYIAHRSSETHAALSRHNELGVTQSATTTADDSSGASGAGLAQAVPAVGEPQHRAMDPRDLLRAIADSDTKRRS